jgi:hypothetical protein
MIVVTAPTGLIGHQVVANLLEPAVRAEKAADATL